MNKALRVLVCVWVATGPAWCEVGIDATGTTALTTNYLFRGAESAPLGVLRDTEASYRFSDIYRAYMGGWSFYQLSGDIRWLETRYELGLAVQPREMVSYVVGWEYFARTSAFGPDTQEFYLGVDFDVPWSPSIRWRYDYDSLVGSYFEFTANKEYGIGPMFAADARLSLGLDAGRNIDTFRDASLGLGLSYRPLQGFSMGPAVELVIPSHEVAGYGARAVGSFSVTYRRVW